MKTLGRVVAIIVVILVLFVGAAFWGLPILTSIHTAKEASPGSRMIPRELGDVSISNASGEALSYLGYDFQVPWSDLDETKTKLYPEEHPHRVVLTFRSGLRLSLSTFPANEFVSGLGGSFRLSPQRSEELFGNDDYEFLQRLYEFTPDKMHHWSLSPDVHNRESFLVLIKSMTLSPSATDGIFRVQNHFYRGFQQGNPQLRSKSILVDLYRNDGSVEFIFDQKNYGNPSGLAQSEINCVVQSLRKR